MVSSVDKLAKTMLSYLKSRGELSLLPKLVEILTGSPEYRQTASRVVVTSAHKLGTPELTKLATFIKKRVPGTYILQNELNPDLLAGFTLQINDTFLDASVLGKINALQNKLAAKE